MDTWQIEFYDVFEKEFQRLSEKVQDELLASLIPLSKLGLMLGRPNVDTLNDSKYAKRYTIHLESYKQG